MWRKLQRNLKPFTVGGDRKQNRNINRKHKQKFMENTMDIPHDI